MVGVAYLLLAASVAAADPLVAVGQEVGGAEVLDVVAHPEFQRIRVRLPEDDAELLVELTRAGPDRQGACVHHGLAVQPRWELLGRSVELEDQPPVVLELCDRLAQRPDAPVELQESKTAPSSNEPLLVPTQGQEVGRQAPPPWLTGLWLALFAACVGSLATAGRRGFRGLNTAERRELLALSVLGVGLRAGLGLWTLLWAPWFGMGRLASSLTSTPDALYGGAYGAWAHLVFSLMGPSAWGLFAAQGLLGALLVPLTWALGRHLGAGVARGAAVVVATSPVAVWLSTTEVMQVPAAWLVAVAMLSAVTLVSERPKTTLEDAVLAASAVLASGLAIHTRPEAIATALLPAAWVVLRGHKRHRPAIGLGAQVLGVLLVLRVLALGAGSGTGAVDYSDYGQLSFWRDLLLPSVGLRWSALSLVWLEPALTSVWALPLAVAGVVASRGRPVRWLVLAWMLLAAMPVLGKAFPLADALRLQLPMTVPVALLVGWGVCVAEDRLPSVDLGRWRGVSTALLLTAALGGGQLARAALSRPSWAAHDEVRLLLGTVDSLPARTTVLFDDASPHSDGWVRWMRHLRPDVDWTGLSTVGRDVPHGDDVLAWKGTSCALTRDISVDEGQLGTRCAAWDTCFLAPLATARVDSGYDGWATMPQDGAEVGFFTVTGCE